jgi:hypothetical protein
MPRCLWRRCSALYFTCFTSTKAQILTKLEACLGDPYPHTSWQQLDSPFGGDLDRDTGVGLGVSVSSDVVGDVRMGERWGVALRGGDSINWGPLCVAWDASGGGCSRLAAQWLEHFAGKPLRLAGGRMLTYADVC